MTIGPPSLWSEFVGNAELKEILQSLIYRVRVEGNFSPFRAFAYGTSRGGKTSSMQFAIKCLLCCNLDLDSLNPCHECANCRRKVELYGNLGWEDFVERSSKGGQTFRFRYIPVDCACITESQLDDVLFELRGEPARLQILYMDEVHRLGRRRMDDRTLVAMEKLNAVVLASSAIYGELDQMFLNRFDERIKVKVPSVEDLAIMLAERCYEFGIQVEGRADLVLKRVAQRCSQVPGLALQVLRRANRARDKRLTVEMAERFQFVVEE